MTRPPIAFTDALYGSWCRAWRQVVCIHARRLANWLGTQPQSVVGGLIRVDWAQAVASLPGLVADLELPSVGDGALGRAYGCLRELEARHRADPRRLSSPPPCVQVGGGRHLLVPPMRHTARPRGAGAGTFKLAGEIGVAGTLGLDYCWVPLQDDDILDWRREAALEVLLTTPRLRLGLAPCATHEAMAWTIEADDPRGRDGRVPMHCLGTRDPETLWPAVESLLAAAYDQAVQVLVLPELVLDQNLLVRTGDWLGRHNLPVPRLRLVVAGSRHCAEGGGFANRCTVLDQGGTILWEQDKRSPFVIDDPGTLDRLSPGCCAPAAFEPTVLGRRLVVRETSVGRLLTPICLDFIDDALWSALGADIFLVPAMSPGLERFRLKAQDLGSRHGAASFVCNAQTAGTERYVAYLPLRKPPVPTGRTGKELFILDIDLYV